MAYPTLKVEIAWTGTIDAGYPTWTDITTYVRSCQITRGRTDDFQNFDTGTAQLVLDNRTRYFDPFYTAGPNYANLVPRKQIRITADPGTGAGYLPIFRGYVAGWPVTWSNAGYDSTVSIDCFDALGLLAAEQLPPDWIGYLRAQYGYYAYYPFDDQPGSLTARSANASNTAATLTGTSGLARFDTLAPGYPWDAKRPTATMTATVQPAFTAIGTVVQYAAGAFISLVNPRPTSDETLWSLGRFQVVNTSTGLVVRAQEAGNTYSYNLGSTYQNFTPFHLILVAASGTAGLYAAYINGVRVTLPAATTSAGGSGYGVSATANVIIQDLFGWGLEAPVLAVSVYDTFAAVNYGYAIANYRETTAAAATRVLSIPSPPLPFTSITSTPEGMTGEMNLGGPLLSVLQKIADTEGGEVFVTKDGTVTFTNRSYAAAQGANPSPLSFTDTGAGLSYRGDMEIRYDADSIRNAVVLSYSGGASYSLTNASSVSSYGVAEQSVDTFAGNLDDAASLAYWYVQTGGVLKPQVSALDVSSNTSNSSWASILGLELMDAIQVTRTPSLGSAFVQKMNVNRIVHDITPDRWRTTLLGSARYTGWFILDVSLLDGPDVLL